MTVGATGVIWLMTSELCREQLELTLLKHRELACGHNAFCTSLPNLALWPFNPACLGCLKCRQSKLPWGQVKPSGPEAGHLGLEAAWVCGTHWQELQVTSHLGLDWSAVGNVVWGLNSFWLRCCHLCPHWGVPGSKAVRHRSLWSTT